MSNNDWRYLTFGLMGSGVVLRSCSQPWGWRGSMLGRAARKAQAAESAQLCMGWCSPGSKMRINAVLSCTASRWIAQPRC